ncbi:5' exonuclease Apollo isoform X2 [Ascaphus truei]|uniref:5' exonuclease Apollo isoform X2 n=1 Tax=Ascaphus truei TaxID=8439 RepID=UPI003F5A7BB4
MPITARALSCFCLRVTLVLFCTQTSVTGCIICLSGDFRYTPRMLNDLPLRNKKIIDVLYLDNTNCDPGHKLPSRQEATNQIKEIIDRHPEHDIVIGLYSIGKESLLVDLAKTFKSWIVVRPLRLELLRILEMENVFVAEEGAGRFRIVEQSEVNYANMMQWNRVYPTLAILPTSRRAKVWHKDIHVVPYSDHSSFDELIEFVAGLEPCSIIPVVKTQVCEVHFQQYLSSRKKPQTCVKIPASVRAYMKRQESTGKTGTERLFKATFPKHVPRGVEFESPEKRPDSTIGFGSLKDNQKSSPNSLDIESINLPKHDMGDSFLNVKRRSRAHMPLTESTVLMSTKSPCPHMTDESDDDVLEMPSRIFWSPKDDNMTAISETSPLSPEATSIVSHDIPDKKVSLFFKCTNMEWKGEDSEKCSVSAGLSIVPWKKQGNSGPQNFHSQVERYFKELHSADGQN